MRKAESKATATISIVYRSFFVRIRRPCNASSVVRSDFGSVEELFDDGGEVLGSLASEPPLSIALAVGFDLLDQLLDLRLAGVGRDFLVDRNNRPLDFSTPGFDLFQNLGRDIATVRESLDHHVPVASLVGGKADSPQPIPQSIDLGLFHQPGENPQRFDGPANRDPKLMDMLDIFVAFLGGERKGVADGLEAGIENSTCHLAHGLIRGDPGDPLAVSRYFGGFGVENLFGGHIHSPGTGRWVGEFPLSNEPNRSAHAVSEALVGKSVIIKSVAQPVQPCRQGKTFDC